MNSPRTKGCRHPGDGADRRRIELDLRIREAVLPARELGVVVAGVHHVPAQHDIAEPEATVQGRQELVLVQHLAAQHAVDVADGDLDLLQPDSSTTLMARARASCDGTRFFVPCLLLQFFFAVERGSLQHGPVDVQAPATARAADCEGSAHAAPAVGKPPSDPISAERRGLATYNSVSYRIPRGRHADLCLQVFFLRARKGRAAEDLRGAAFRLPGLRGGVVCQAVDRRRLSAQGQRLVRDRLQERFGGKAYGQAGRCEARRRWHAGAEPAAKTATPAAAAAPACGSGGCAACT